METTDFETIASSLTVRSICSPLGPDIEPGTDIGDALKMLELEDSPSRVIGNGGTAVGIVWYQDLVEHGELDGGAYECLEPSHFLSADTNILNTISYFSKKKDYFYILDENNVIGILYYHDIFQPLGRLALLALALEIEQLALVLCSMLHLRDQCWGALTENRQSKAQKLYKLRSRHPSKEIKVKVESIKGLIECTSFCDKKTMILKNDLVEWNVQDNVDYLGQRPMEITTSKCFSEIFQKLEKIRDRCAHTGFKNELSEKYPPEVLGKLIELTKDLKKKLAKAIEYNLPKEGDALLNTLR